jgi:ribonuclease D
LTETAITSGKPDVYLDDLPDNVLQRYLSKDMIAIDTETRGLVVHRDRLCLVQFCDAEGVVSFVRYKGQPAPNMIKLLTEPSVVKLFHFGRFDIGVLKYYLGVWATPVWCTKIASKLVRTYTDRHSLKELVRELLQKELDKSDQSSDWAREDLSDSQLEYAANDVRVLVPLQRKLHSLLERENRLALAEKLFHFLPTQCEIDLAGFKDIYEH